MINFFNHLYMKSIFLASEIKHFKRANSYTRVLKTSMFLLLLTNLYTCMCHEFWTFWRIFIYTNKLALFEYSSHELCNLFEYIPARTVGHFIFTSHTYIHTYTHTLRISGFLIYSSFVYVWTRCFTIIRYVLGVRYVKRNWKFFF